MIKRDSGITKDKYCYVKIDQNFNTKIKFRSCYCVPRYIYPTHSCDCYNLMVHFKYANYATCLQLVVRVRFVVII